MNDSVQERDIGAVDVIKRLPQPNIVRDRCEGVRRHAPAGVQDLLRVNHPNLT